MPLIFHIGGFHFGFRIPYIPNFGANGECAICACFNFVCVHSDMNCAGEIWMNWLIETSVRGIQHRWTMNDECECHKCEYGERGWLIK